MTAYRPSEHQSTTEQTTGAATSPDGRERFIAGDTLALLRAARPEEVDDILILFEEEVRAGKMLPRPPDEVRAHIDDWIVAEADGRVVGCVSLVFFDGELCEVRSLAVHPTVRGHGLGSALVRAAIDLARERGMGRVLALTRSVSLFERLDFRRDLVANFPEKVWRDCEPCPFKDACDEVALIYRLALPESGNGQRT